MRTTSDDPTTKKMGLASRFYRACCLKMEMANQSQDVEDH
jgi:hypothetical protein